MSVKSIIRRDRAVVASGLAGVALVAWLYLLHLSSRGTEMPAMSAMPGMVMTEPWGAREVGLTFLMWAVMMVGMMVPSAAPMVLVFATVNRKRGAAGGAAVPTGVFLAGYLAIWTAFSLAAALGQWGLQSAALVSPLTLTATPVAGGVLLVAAGVYQLTPLKSACLSRCQSPLGFLLGEWREGAGGAFVMGLRHGAFCVGCCWALMALLFVAGVMNLLWVAAIAALVFLEKLVPAGRAVSWAAGSLLVAWGVWVIGRSV